MVLQDNVPGEVYQGRIGEVPKSVAREIEARKKSDIISGVHIPEKIKRIENITFERMAKEYVEYSLIEEG